MNPPQQAEKKTERVALYRRAIWVAVLYAVVAALWIWLSDAFVERVVDDPDARATWQSYKGWAFVLVTALLLWAEREWGERRLREANSRLTERMQERTSELDRVRGQLQIILDNAPVSFAMRSVDNRYMLTNHEWEKVMGVSSEDALGKTPYDLFQPKLAEDLTQALAQIWEKRAGILEELPLHLEGRDYYFMRASFPLFNDDGQPYAAIALVTDISERKAVEESLRQAEERFRAVFQTVGVGINLISPSGHYLATNPAFERMLGYTEAELLGKHFNDITHAEDRVPDHVVREQIDDGPGRMADFEKRYVRADGELVWAHVLISEIRNNDGTVALQVSVVEDITARKEAELQQKQMQAELERVVAQRTAELQQLHDELAEAQRLAQVGNWNIDLKTNRLQWSAETYRIFGYEPNAFEGSRETFLSTIHPDDRALANQVRQDALAGQPMDYEHRVVRPNGEIRIVHERGYVVRDEAGNPTSIFGTVQDITERKEAEEEIRAVNERLSAILQASPLGIIVLGPDRAVQLWNPAAEQIYGYPADEVLGKPVPELQVPGDPTYLPTRARVFSGERVEGVESKRKRSDGTVIDVSISTAPVRAADGTLTAIVALVRDITERKRVEAEVYRLNQELEARVTERTHHLELEIAERVRAEEAIKELNATLAEQAQHLVSVNKELETFTYSVSHDLKAPLRGIDGYSRLLLEDHIDRLDEEGQYFLHTIRGATTQMAQLIDDLLSYSRLERRTWAVSQVDIRNIVEGVLSHMQSSQVYPQTKIEVCVASQLVVTDADALAMILRNLIDNALKFSANSPQPCIEITGEVKRSSERTGENPAEASGDTYALSVRDNGVGFDMQYQERIFEIFQRLHRSEDYPGTGIGLAIVRKALQRMQGRIYAESQLGQGATFTMEIPL